MSKVTHIRRYLPKGPAKTEDALWVESPYFEKGITSLLGESLELSPIPMSIFAHLEPGTERGLSRTTNPSDEVAEDSMERSRVSVY